MQSNKMACPRPDKQDEYRANLTPVGYRVAQLSKRKKLAAFRIMCGHRDLIKHTER